MKGIGLYIHIPFCETKCRYCDFLSFKPSDGDIYAYIKVLANEIKNAEIKDKKIETVFIGGGNPGCLPPPSINCIFDALRGCDILPDAEITFEANPGSLNRKKLELLLRCGVNRLSLGLQTTDAALLAAIGRSHSLQDFYDSYGNARDSGFSNINVDIMFSLPGQTSEHIVNTCEAVTRLDPEHISAYALIPEEGTAIKKMLDSGELTMPEDETDRAMYETIKRYMKNSGYIHYEISNFAKEGFFCRHNVSYWERGEYLGFGLGAHSFYEGERYSNTADFKKYLIHNGDKDKITENRHIINDKEATEETMFLGLRMLGGVFLTDKLADVYEKQIRSNISAGLLKLDGRMLSLTERGLDLANLISADFLL